MDDDKQAMDVDDDALEGTPDEEGDFIFGLNTIVNITKPKVSHDPVNASQEALNVDRAAIHDVN